MEKELSVPDYYFFFYKYIADSGLIVFLTIVTSIRITELCRSFISKVPLDPEEIHTKSGAFSQVV